MRRTVLATAIVLAAAGCRGTDGGAPQETRYVKPSTDYPLRECLVSGEELARHGEPVAIRYGGVEVQFCCGDCVREFRKEPDRYLEMLEAARAAKAAK